MLPLPGPSNLSLGPSNLSPGPSNLSPGPSYLSPGRVIYGGGGGGGGGVANSKKVNTHPKIPEIDLDFFRLILTFNKIVQILAE